ncbi:Ctr copper transporter protein [Dioscorea alata]|uniref:Ctr copper transporter protein n=1 Tax=Dioscorea alata TaxID=55571 RepID=A0ACB7VUE7_DIOAL|nr:Ctr copper transporter protein [Dioscorea alata]
MMAPAPPETPSSGMGGMKHMGGGGMMMHMTFFWGKRVQILFTGWPGDQGIGMYLLSLLCVLLVAALVELLSGVSRRVARPNASSMSMGLSLTVLHALRIGLAYLVMLAVMSFNVGVLIAAIVGHALGFLFTGSGFFKWSRPTVDPAGGDAFPSTKA